MESWQNETVQRLWLRVRLCYWHTFGSVSRYDNGTCISERILLLISMAILWIWLAWSLFCCNSRCMRSDSPESGTHGSGNHHLSSLRWNDFLLSLKDWFLWSAYQNSGLWKLSNIPYRKKFSHTLWYQNGLLGSCESRLTRSMVSSFSSAGRFIRMSDLGEVAITCWNQKIKNLSQDAMRIDESHQDLRWVMIWWHYIMCASIRHGLDGGWEFDNVFTNGEEAIHLPVPHWSLLRRQWLQPVAGPKHCCCSQEQEEKPALYQSEFKGWMHDDFSRLDTI